MNRRIKPYRKIECTNSWEIKSQPHPKNIVMEKKAQGQKDTLIVLYDFIGCVIKR